MDEEDPLRAAYDRSYPRLVTQMLAMCGNRAEAEDVVQEAFLAAMTHRPDFAGVTQPLAPGAGRRPGPAAAPRGAAARPRR